MFDIAWTEILVIAVVAVLVIGPRDLPKTLRSVGSFMGQMRRMAGDFQKQFNDALREAELDEVKRGIEGVRKANPASHIRDSLNPLKQAGDSIRDSIEGKGSAKSAPAKPDAAAKPANGKAPAEKPEAPATEAPKPAPPAKKTAAASDSKPAAKPKAAAKPAARKKAPAKSAATKSRASKSASGKAAAKPSAKSAD